MTEDAKDAGAIILAAGKGTRMKSDKAKVLHEIGGNPMVSYVLDSARQVVGNNIVLVIGHQADTVRKVLSGTHRNGVSYALQSEQLGTGHAVQCAMPHIDDRIAHIVILCGDTPLVRADTIRCLLSEHAAEDRDLTVLAMELEDPAGYGRILIDESNRVTGIVEDADATPEQKGIRIVNSGIYCTTRAFLVESLDQIDSNNAQEEFYLTDILAIGRREGKNVGALVWQDSMELMGVNTLDELELSETIMKKRSGKTS